MRAGGCCQQAAEPTGGSGPLRAAYQALPLVPPGIGPARVEPLPLLPARRLGAGWLGPSVLRPLIFPPSGALQALSSVRSLRQALQLGSASSFAAAFVTAVAQALAPGPRLVLAPPGARLSLPLVLGVAGLLAGGAQQALGRLERQFVFVDYVHADRK